MTDVVLVVPPHASAALPALGASVLVAALRREGLTATVHYANLAFAARIGWERARRFSLSSSGMHGEIVFAGAAWGREAPAGSPAWGDHSDAVTPEDMEVARAAVGGWLEESVAAILALDPTVVGFSSVFQQTVPSIALGRALRAARPSLVLLLGGANAAWPMAQGIADTTDVFDLVVAGECDEALPDLVRRLLAGDRPPGRTLRVENPRTLERVARPVYDDYLAQVAPMIAARRLPQGLPVAVPFESSRGCWWGALSHCTFCGLNGLTIAERALAPDRVLADIEAIVTATRVTELRAADDLLPLRIQREVLPALVARQAARATPLRLFYEVKSSLRRRELRLLAAAGVTAVQAGIESLSTDTLRAMGKGVTAPMNLRFLREARGAGIDVLWNWMVGFPGDGREDYEGPLRLLPLLEHLQPPQGLAPVRIDRFSPYHRDPAAYGIEAVEPLPAMAMAWPARADLPAIAAHFTGRIRSPYRDDAALARRVHHGLARWQEAWGNGALLTAEVHRDQLVVRDSRRLAHAPTVMLTTDASALLIRLETPRPVEALSGSPGLAPLIQRGFVVQHEGLLISVVVRPDDQVMTSGITASE